MNKRNLIPLILTALAMLSDSAVYAAEFHVGSNGNDNNPGTKSAPLGTIQRAADLAQPGDVITVHSGVYRERVNPPRGGTSDSKRIVYQAARGERVEIKGSEIIRTWTRVKDDVWKVTLPNSFFGDFNPYADLLRGDWFDRRNRDHHSGAVYLNGEWLTEAAQLDDVMKPPGAEPLWFGQVDRESTTIWAQFRGVDPNEELVEINVRQTVFYPDKPGRNYITVRGFAMRHAATPWAPPTAEQIGLLGTHWSKGWIIEDNEISHSTCTGITLGKYGDQYDNSSANTAEGYVKTIERALQNGWNRESIGHHVVRRNTISHCEQAGIVGSLGAAFSSIVDNTIHEIHVRRLFSGAEMAGIKLHAAIDTTIRGNHIYRTCRGLWLDWMAQGTRVSRNLFHQNSEQDLFVEVNHGPFMVDNNLFLSDTSLLDMSEGGAYAHNLFAGKIVSTEEPDRQTPYHPAHSTALAGLSAIRGGDNRFFNNVFVGKGETTGEVPGEEDRHRRVSGYGLWVYDARELPLQTGGNVYYRGARPYRQEDAPVVEVQFDPGLLLKVERESVKLQLLPGPDLKAVPARLVTTERLGKATVSELPYENPDGSRLEIGTDYFGRKRHKARPTPGPFENPSTGSFTLIPGE